MTVYRPGGVGGIPVHKGKVTGISDGRKSGRPKPKSGGAKGMVGKATAALKKAAKRPTPKGAPQRTTGVPGRRPVPKGAKAGSPPGRRKVSPPKVTKTPPSGVVPGGGLPQRKALRMRREGGGGLRPRR